MVFLLRALRSVLQPVAYYVKRTEVPTVVYSIESAGVGVASVEDSLVAIMAAVL